MIRKLKQQKKETNTALVLEETGLTPREQVNDSLTTPEHPDSGPEFPRSDPDWLQHYAQRISVVDDVIPREAVSGLDRQAILLLTLTLTLTLNLISDSITRPFTAVELRVRWSRPM